MPRRHAGWLAMPERLAYSQKEAAAQLCLSVPFFREYVRPDLKAVYVGSLVRYPAAELERWLSSQ